MTDERESMTADEALSALVDGEVGSATRGRLVDRLLDDPEMRARWTAYHAGRAALDGTGRSALGSDFSERVLAAVREEPAILAPRRRAVPEPAPRRWMRPVAGVAVAASVALVAFGGLLALRDSGIERGGEPVLADAADEIAPLGAGVSPVAIDANFGGSLDGEAQARVRQRLAIYMSRHSGFAGGGEMPGVMPHSRMVGFNAGQ